MSQAENDDPIQGKMPLLSHLQELRKVIVVSVIAIFVASVVAFTFVDTFLFIITKPVTDLGIKLVFIAVTEGIFFKFHVSLLVGLVVASPILLWQFWCFLVPALYPRERGYIARLVPASIILFFGGVTFAYFTVLRFMIYFLIKFSGEFEPMISVSKYLSFILGLLIPFGLLFEFPLLVYFLAKIGILTPQSLIKYRKISIVCAFILAAILTPSPDPFTQIVVAIPMLVLYEVGIIVARIVARQKRLKLDELASEQS